MRKIILTIILLYSLHTAFAQAYQKQASTGISLNSDEYKAAGPMPKTINQFIPKGYEVLAYVEGNLNLDSFTDAILILRVQSEEKLSNADAEKHLKRPFLILTGTGEHNFRLACRNDDAVYDFNYSGNMLGDPFSKIVIKNGYFSVESWIAGGPQHWNQVTTFKYDKTKSDWFLYKDHFEDYKLNPSEDPNADAMIKSSDRLKTVKNFGIISFKQFNADRLNN